MFCLLTHYFMSRYNSKRVITIMLKNQTQFFFFSFFLSEYVRADCWLAKLPVLDWLLILSTLSQDVWRIKWLGLAPATAQVHNSGVSTNTLSNNVKNIISSSVFNNHFQMNLCKPVLSWRSFDTFDKRTSRDKWHRLSQDGCPYCHSNNSVKALKELGWPGWVGTRKTLTHWLCLWALDINFATFCGPQHLLCKADRSDSHFTPEFSLA